jgi:hypothetical protein
MREMPTPAPKIISLNLLIRNLLMYAKINPVGADPEKRIPLQKILENKGITPQYLVQERIFIGPEGIQPTWENLTIGADREDCVQRLARLLGCEIHYWQKQGPWTLPAYLYVGAFS